MILSKRIMLVLLISLVVSLGMLSACQTTQNTSGVETTRQNKIDNALSRAATSAMNAGQTEQALSILEKSYQKNNGDVRIATQYAQALRKTGESEKADLILHSFANKPDASLDTLQEYASIQLELGHYVLAEQFAAKVLAKDQKKSEAHHVLGIALDAQGKHEQAEGSLRTALDMWEGDPVPIMNNLALNLAAQEHVQEAVDILKKAKSIAPNRIEIERNLRIISTLNEAPKAFKAH